MNVKMKILHLVMSMLHVRILQVHTFAHAKVVLEEMVPIAMVISNCLLFQANVYINIEPLQRYDIFLFY